ncbi:hypothetical protein Nans01_48320 [Nocardiopsis ansamitocini]|uniref:wHTH-Hsp90 Na associated domain-containing protein n=1 Tax=Nocardiopsis ansamitocini TaxID=1670832 RepID=A0A9W6PBJ2_9ACTN|nr:hypothetical protein Nans01_48320 [Nocardiopsis ansamitocini]
MSEDDLRIVSADLDGESPWLETGEPVSLIRLLRTAEAVELSPVQVRDRLAELGYTRIPDRTAAEAGQPDDLLLAGATPEDDHWLDTDDEVDLGHVVRAAERTGRSPAYVRDRLAELGFTGLPQGGLPETLEPEDLALVESGPDGGGALSGVDDEVALIHLLRVASRTGRSPVLAYDRLVALGFTDLPSRNDVEALTPDDLRIVSVGLDGRLPWLNEDETVTLVHLLAAGVAMKRPPVEVYDRLAELGLDNLPFRGRVETLRTSDVRIISAGLDGRFPWLDTNAEIPLGHILRAAEQTDIPPVYVHNRLAILGYTDLPQGGLPEKLEPGDARITSRDLNGEAPWLEVYDEVSLPHVLGAASALERSPASVRDRLALLGYADLPQGELPETLEPDDAQIVSRDLNGGYPWRAVDQQVPPNHVLEAAEKTGRSPEYVRDRLAAFGYTALPQDPLQ